MSKNKQFFWLKQPHDFFQNLVIKKLRKVAGGDTYTIIYQKIMLLSVKNAGIFEYQGVEKTPIKELALILDEDEDNVAITMAFMESNGLIEQISENEFLLVQVPSLIGVEGSSAERMRKLRAKKVSLCDNNVQSSDKNVTLEIEKEKEKEIEIEIEKEIELDNSSSLLSEESCEPHQKFLEAWNEFAVQYGLSTIKLITEARARQLKARQKKYKNFFELFEQGCIAISKSNFLLGKVKGRDWKASFDWLIANNDNIIGLIEGRYGEDNKPSVVDSYLEMRKQGYTLADLEQMGVIK